MSKRLYVGNLPFSVTQEQLQNLFSNYGALGEVLLVINKHSGRSKGFGFVTIEDDAQADKAISEMNGKDIEGRALTVNEARPFDPDKPRPTFRRRFGNGGGGRRFGDRDNRSGGDRGFGRRRFRRDDSEE